MTRLLYQAPGTRLWRSNVEEWCDRACQLNRRRLSRKRHRDLETHGMCMPLRMIEIEDDIEAIDRAPWLFTEGPTGLQRPQRGTRGDHPTTPIIMALKYRKALLKREADEIPQGANGRADHDPG